MNTLYACSSHCICLLEISGHSGVLRSSKTLLIGHIKQSFELEAQNCQHQKIKEAETTDPDAHEMEDKLHRMKRRCAKLEKKLQEKDAELQALQEQQQLQFPLLMHETMQSLRSIDSKDSHITANSLPLSHSVISGKAHENRDGDIRIFEYERQIADLYEENQREKLKNEMLNECLREQKHAKAKLMKACKHVKQELQTMKDSGLSQMLVDIEARCNALEKEKNQLEVELQEERYRRAEQENKVGVVTIQLEKLLSEFAKWKSIVARKNRELQLARDQIREQQLSIENLKGDLKTADQRMARSPEIENEVDRLKCALNVERAKCVSIRQDLERLIEDNISLRDHQTSLLDKTALEEDTAGSPRATMRNDLAQVRLIQNKLLALTRIIQTYGDTSFVDMNLFDGNGCSSRDLVLEEASQLTEAGTALLSEEILEAARYLSELQQVVEDVCARLMGSTCAMQ